MPGMFGGGGMSGQDMLNLANQEAALNRTNTWSPIYGGTTWSRTPGTQGGTTNVGPQPGWTHDPTSGMPIEFMSKDWTTPMSSGGGGPVEVPPGSVTPKRQTDGHGRQLALPFLVADP